MTNVPECEPIAERILVVKLGAMGDVLRTTSCLAPLKERYPQSHITWVTRTTRAPLIAGNRWVDRVLPIEGNYLELLLSEQFDLVLGLEAETLLCRHRFAGERRGEAWVRRRRPRRHHPTEHRGARVVAHGPR